MFVCLGQKVTWGGEYDVYKTSEVNNRRVQQGVSCTWLTQDFDHWIQNLLKLYQLFSSYFTRKPNFEMLLTVCRLRYFVFILMARTRQKISNFLFVIDDTNGQNIVIRVFTIVIETHRSAYFAAAEFWCTSHKLASCKLVEYESTEL